jgi:hypothetical protein
MYWWHNAAELLTLSTLRQFGFITTNSITQPFNRIVVENHDGEVGIHFAIPDHPWVDSADGAAVRIAMTTAALGVREGTLARVTSEDEGEHVELVEERGIIHPNLTCGVNTHDCMELEANRQISSQGANPLGLGFRLSPEDLAEYGYNVKKLPKTIRPYMIGKDLVQNHEAKFVIDFFGMSESESRQHDPIAFNHLLVHVKPERDQNRRETRKRNWWLFGENAPMFRDASKGLSRYIATCRTAKHRIFSFVSGDTIPDAKIVAIALDDAFHLGCLCSKVHVNWSYETGGWLGVGNDSNYNHSDCFAKFPFPNATESQKSRIRELGEQLDAHRKRQQAAHPKLTMTGMYNVLEKLRAGDALTKKEQEIHEQGLVSVLREIHDELDAAVADAYGWPADHSDEEILTRLVALNHERAEEERRGIIRWLRPEFQNPTGKKQTAIAVADEPVAEKKAAKATKQSWPKSLSEQAGAVLSSLATFSSGATARDIARSFGRATDGRVERVEEILETLEALGKARELDDGRYVAV